MANSKTRVRRIAITPSAELRALLEELSEVAGKSLSSVASEMLEEILPVMRMQLDAFREIQKTPDRAREHLLAMANNAHGDISQAVMEFEKVDARTMEGKKKRRASGANPKP
jgi:hypothetical protein